jgi:hypothetical protein
LFLCWAFEGISDSSGGQGDFRKMANPVGNARAERLKPVASTGVVPLVHPPGEARVDFGSNF